MAESVSYFHLHVPLRLRSAFLCLVWLNVILGGCGVYGWQYGPLNNYDCTRRDGEVQEHMLQGLTYEFTQANPINNGFNIVPSTSVYRAGNPVTFTVTSAQPQQAAITIKGFMFQAFDPAGNRVGMWSSPASPTAVPVQTSTCATNTSNTITHGISLKGMQPLVLVWTPPMAMGTGRVNFVCNTMAAYGNYWITHIQMDEDVSVEAPQNVVNVQVTSAIVTATGTTVTVQWAPPVLTGNPTVSIASYTILAVNSANTSMITPITISGTLIQPNAQGLVTYTINNVLQAAINYSISVIATNSAQIASSPSAFIVRVALPAAATTPTLTIPTPSLTYTSTSSYNNGGVLVTPANPAGTNGGNLISSGTGTGVTATITFTAPPEAAAAGLQMLSMVVSVQSAATGATSSITFATPNLPAVNPTTGNITIVIPKLNGMTTYSFFAVLTYTNAVQTTTLPVSGTTGGCLNSCSGNGYCHPLLLVCHCDTQHVGMDCSIPLTNPYFCGFGQTQSPQNLCLTWTFFNWTGFPGPLTVPSVDATYTMLYYRFRGNVNGGHFAWMWNGSVIEGHQYGIGFTVAVNKTTNETWMGFPKGLQAWNGNHAQGPSPGMWMIGYYDSVAGVTDVQWWQFAIATSLTAATPKANNNQWSFVNLKAGPVKANFSATWSTGTGTLTRHDVWNRGKVLIDVANFVIMPIGQEPNYIQSYAPLAVFVGAVLLGAAAYGVLPRHVKHKVLTSRLFNFVLPSKLTSGLLLPAQQLFLSRRRKDQSTVSRIAWRLARRAVYVMDMISFHVRGMLGALVWADAMVTALYCALVVIFVVNMQMQYANITNGTDSRYVYGHIILWHISLLVVPITRNSIFVLLLGMPFERALKYHRWLGRLTLLWIGIHFYTESLYFNDTIQNIALNTYLNDNGALIPNNPSYMQYYLLSWDTPYGQGIIYGFAAFLVCAAIVFFALSEVRRSNFRVFYISHMIGWPAFFILSQYHMRWTYYFLIPGAVLYVLDRFIRLYKIFRYSGRAVRLELLRDEHKLVRSAVRLEIPITGEWSPKPGQYAFIMIPSISFMFHPYTISASQYQLSLDSDGKVQCTKSAPIISVHLLSMGRRTFSDSVVSMAKRIQFGDMDRKQKLPWVLVDGFYSRFSFDLEHYSHIIIVAGGIGVTPFFSLLPELVYQYMHRKDVPRETPLKSIKFVWSARTSTGFKTWNRELIDGLLQLNNLVEVQLFESRSSVDTEYGFELRSTNQAPQGYSAFSPVVSPVVSRVNSANNLWDLPSQLHLPPQAPPMQLEMEEMKSRPLPPPKPLAHPPHPPAGPPPEPAPAVAAWTPAPRAFLANPADAVPPSLHVPVAVSRSPPAERAVGAWSPVGTIVAAAAASGTRKTTNARTTPNTEIDDGDDESGPYLGARKFTEEQSSVDPDQLAIDVNISQRKITATPAIPETRPYRATTTGNGNDAAPIMPQMASSSPRFAAYSPPVSRAPSPAMDLADGEGNGNASMALPVIKGRPEWDTLFRSFDSAIGSEKAAVLVCGPIGMIASVQEQAAMRKWPFHNEQFFF